MGARGVDGCRHRLIVQHGPTPGHVALRAEPESGCGKPGSHTFAVAVERTEVLTGLELFFGGPDLPKILEHDGLIYLVDVDAGSIRQLATLPLSKSVGCRTELRVSEEWDGDSFFVTEYSCEHPDRVYRFSRDGAHQEVDRIPPTAHGSRDARGELSRPYVSYTAFHPIYPADQSEVTMPIAVESERWRRQRTAYQFLGQAAKLEAVAVPEDPIAQSSDLQLEVVSEKPDSDLFAAVVRDTRGHGDAEVHPDESCWCSCAT
jgi:hypothetical protein